MEEYQTDVFVKNTVLHKYARLHKHMCAYR